MYTFFYIKKLGIFSLVFNIHSFVDYMQLHLLLFLNVNVVLYCFQYFLLLQLLLLDLHVFLQFYIIYYNVHNMFLFHFHVIQLLSIHMNLYILQMLLSPLLQLLLLYLFWLLYLILYDYLLLNHLQHQILMLLFLILVL